MEQRTERTTTTSAARCEGLPAELIRIEATLAVASLLGSRKPRRSASVSAVSSRVLRPGRGGCRTLYTVVRPGHEGLSGAPRRLCGTLEGGGAPVLSRLV